MKKLGQIQNIGRYYSFFSRIVMILLALSFSLYITAQKLPVPPEQYRSAPIIIEGDQSFPPFEFLDEKGQPAGFNVDLTQEIMKALGITNYKIVLKNWHEVLEDYHSDKAYLIMGMMYSDSRSKQYMFGASHGNVYQDVIYRRGTNPIKSLNDLNNKRIVVENQSINHDMLLEHGFSKNVYPIGNPSDALRLLSEGKYDAMVCDHEMAVFLIYKLGITNLEVTDLGLPPHKYCFVSKNTDFLSAVEHSMFDIKAKGIYEELFNKWNNKNDTTSFSHIVYLVIVCLIICAFVLSVFNALLRRRVSHAQNELNLKNQRLALALHAGDIIVWGYNVKEKRYFNVECDLFPPEGRYIDEEVSYFHPDEQVFYRKTIESLSRGETPPKKLCFRIDYTKKGDWRYTEKEFVQIKDKNGNVETIIGTHLDVTDSKLRHKLINELLNKYHTVFSSTSVGLEYYDYRGVLTDMNDVIKQLFGIRNINTILSKQYTLFGNPILKNYVSAKMSEPVSFIVKVDFAKLQPSYAFKKTGIYYLDININPVKGDDERIECYIVSYKDITDMRVLQRQLQENIRKTEDAIKSADMIFWEIDTKSLMITSYGNHHNEDDKLNIYLYDFIKHINPNDLGVVLPNLEKMKKGFNETLNAEVRIWSEEDMRWHYCSINATPFDVDENNHVTKYVGFRKDNTNLIQMSEDLRSYNEKLDYLLKESNIQIWDYDFNDRMISVRSGSNEMYEKMALDEYCNRLEEPDKSEVKELFGKMHDGSADTFSNLRKLTYTDHDKGIRYVIFNGIPIRDHDGKVVSYFGLRRDVTDMIEIQNNLEKQMEKAQQADKLKSAFLANMSHEIRTPLNAIVGFSNLLQTTDDPNVKSEFVNLINANNDLLLRLINDILDLSKIESGVIEIASEEMDMSLCFDETVSSLQSKIVHPEVKFISINPYQHCYIYSDRNRIAQIITNFVTNALKYTPKGYVKATYCYVNNGIKIAVEDSGIGIASEKQHLIFQRFEKLDDFAQGNGLGLSICKAITDTCQGKIGFESQAQKGSTFWAWIPCKLKEPIQKADGQIELLTENNEISAVDSPAKESKEDYDNQNLSETNHLINYRILVAEDNESNYLLIKAYLKGYMLEHAVNGERAVEMARKNHYNLILMDVKMPVMDGLTATSEIRKFNVDIPIITLTAYAFDNDKKRAMDSGATDFLTKPLQEIELKTMIYKYI